MVLLKLVQLLTEGYANRSLFSAMLISTGLGSIAKRVFEAMNFPILFHKQHSNVTLKTITLKIIC